MRLFTQINKQNKILNVLFIPKCKKNIFSFFLDFLLNHIRIYLLLRPKETLKLHCTSLSKKTTFYFIKCGIRGYISHGHVILMHTEFSDKES